MANRKKPARFVLDSAPPMLSAEDAALAGELAELDKPEWAVLFDRLAKESQADLRSTLGLLMHAHVERVTGVQALKAKAASA